MENFVFIMSRNSRHYITGLV